MERGEGIFIGMGGGKAQLIPFARANRHGLVAGATGTGKTVTLQGMVEDLSAAGVPCFVADVKGDLSGLAMPGSPAAKAHAAFAQRAKDIGEDDWSYGAVPVVFWDLFGEQGHPIRATVSEMGPLLLARLLGLNEVQEGVLAIAFHVADAEGLLLLDLDDLQAMLGECAARASELSAQYGNISKQSVGAIQRGLLQLRGQDADRFFGEPALDLHDFLRRDDGGGGVVNILAADKLMASPKLYATFLLWLLSELFEALPEVGDPERPVLCFFFDEAHLLFEDAPPALLDKIEQVVRLIRSKGVGVYFITQNPIDIPDTVAGQLGNRMQHALRAFTPRDQAAVRAAAQTFRPNPPLKVESAISELKVGEALVSVLDADGAPTPVERTLVKPPRSRVGPVTPAERQALLATDGLGEKYDQPVNRESAHERLQAKAAAAQAAAAGEEPPGSVSRSRAEPSFTDQLIRTAGRTATSTVTRAVANEVTRAIFGSGRGSRSGGIGGQIVRGVLGGLFRGASG